jgi:hypothetical protein
MARRADPDNPIGAGAALHDAGQLRYRFSAHFGE